MKSTTAYVTLEKNVSEHDPQQHDILCCRHIDIWL